MQVDYIVVGIGLAGISFCEQLKKENKTFVVFDDTSQQSSLVAAGLYNPVILKRFTSVWNSKEQLEIALPMYANLEKEFNEILDYKVPVYRKFASVEEQNNWFEASDNPLLAPLLSTNIINNTNASIDAPFGFGEVLNTGRIDVKRLVELYKRILIEKNILFEESFNYNSLITNEQNVKYNGITANHIVFCEGFGITKNPFFDKLPLVPVKGELIVIHAPDLQSDTIIKSSVFVIPLGNNNYSVGATYEWKDLTNATTHKAKELLLAKLKKLITCNFTVVNHVAGIRPTVKDRRPLVGKHSDLKNTYVLNGLGTRGVMIGPYAAKELYNHIEHGKPLDPDIDIKRFLK